MPSTEPLSQDEINDALADLGDWSYEGDKINATFEFGDFREAISFIVKVAFEAEERFHHPEIQNVYNTVRIALTTHDAGNKVTAKDIDLAQAIDAVASR